MTIINYILPISQVSPANSSVQEHLKCPRLAGSSSQLPPFAHGLGSQGAEADNKRNKRKQTKRLNSNEGVKGSAVSFHSPNSGR